MGEPPLLNRRIVESLLRIELQRPRATERRLVLVHGRYQPTEPGGPAEFTVEVAGRARRVRISDQQSVLGITEAWQSYLDSDPGGDGVLVVTTGVDDAQLGWDLRAYALGRATRTVDRVEIVKQRFGTVDVDPRIRTEPWLVDALLDAEPPTGWRRPGSVLTRDAALRALVGVRLGLDRGTERAAGGTDRGTGGVERGAGGAGGADPGAGPAGGTLDVDTLLGWSRQPAGPARFAALPAAERDGLTGWLTEQVGPAAPVLMGLAAAGRAGDAMALGVIGTVVTGPDPSADAALAFGGLLGAVTPGKPELRAFTDAVEGTLERWITLAESGGAHAGAFGQRVHDVLGRAEELAAAAGLGEALAGNRFLPSGLGARLRALAGTLSATPDPAAVSAAEAALRAVRDHSLAGLYQERVVAADMAVRLVRWLSTPETTVRSVPGGVRTHLAEWGWVDRACAVLWAGDPASDPVVGAAYREVYRAARARRDALDEAFAGRLAIWARHADTLGPDGCLLVEDVLAQVVAPLAGGRAPLVLVADGMSSAVAVELGEGLATRSWIEVSTDAHRRAAVAALPSLTRVSRSSLLAGRAKTGDQRSEKRDFVEFWRARRRDAALFHKGEIGGDAGQRLAEPLLAALAGDGVVGVVLNTIDEALDHGREAGRPGWTLTDIGYLPELLDAARNAGRPVVLVSDHGHVPERGPADRGPREAPGAESPRWRPVTGGPAGDGEVELAGPRVLRGDGRVVAAWREDVRYTARRSGYHGGVALAELTVPVLVLVPPGEDLPAGWGALPPEATTPAWWVQRRAAEAPASSAPPAPSVSPGGGRAGGAPAGGVPARRTGRSRAPVAGAEPLFQVEPAPAPASPAPPPMASPVAAPVASLGARVVASPVYAAQRRFVRRAPDPGAVTAVLDALAGADDGELTVAAVAAAAGRSGRNPEGLAATLERLLNVEGYPVLSTVDGGRAMRLDTGLLRDQFGLGTENPR